MSTCKDKAARRRNSSDSPQPTGIIFWDQYPQTAAGTRTIGGIERLIANLSYALGRTVPVKLIARKDSVICELLKDRNAQYVRLDPSSNLSKGVAPSDLLVSFGTYRNLTLLGAANPSFLLWRVYPVLGADGPLSRALFRKMLLDLDALDALVFMDVHCRNVTNREFKIQLDSPILRIPIEVPPQHYTPRDAGGDLRITYVGRGSEIWKVKPVKALLRDLSRIRHRRFELHIFTDTDRLFRDELPDVASDNVAVKYHLGVFGDRLTKALLELSDLHFSMGTAALEGAALGIPTIIADASHEDFPEDYAYRWLHKDPDHYAGVFLDSEGLQLGARLDALIRQFESVEGVTSLSIATRHAVEDHFSLDAISQQLMAMKPRARLSTVLRLMPHYWMTRLAIRSG